MRRLDSFMKNPCLLEVAVNEKGIKSWAPGQEDMLQSSELFSEKALQHIYTAYYPKWNPN